MRAAKLLLITGIMALMAGCKLAIINVEGGEVQSTGSGTCVAGTVCLVDVTDTNFSETFTAVPDEGWYFHKWNQGGRFFCGNSFNPACSLSFEGLQGEENIEALVASSEVFYLMPVFKPYTDVVSVDGKQWLQPDLFKNVTWNEINAVCPGGDCIEGGILSGHDMTGWTWASVDELNALFNYYLGADLMGPGPGGYELGYGGDYEADAPPPNQDFANDFFGDGWRPEEVFLIDRNDPVWTREICGWTSDDIADDLPDEKFWGFFGYVEYPDFSFVQIYNLGITIGGEECGGWFYRAL